MEKLNKIYRNFFHLSLLLFFILVGFSCQKDAPLPTNGNISGRVTDNFNFDSCN